MTYWENRQASAANLRLFEARHGWRAHDDVKNDQGQISALGSHNAIEMALHNALNASNLIVLTGSGSSFCAKNASRPSAPSMAGLWDAVESAVTPAKLAAIIAKIPSAADLKKNIEKLLTLCKLHSVLFPTGPDAGEIAAFIVDAEQAILKRVDFVNEETDLASHRNFVRKLARRSIRKSRARIFTTNYDLCFEAAAREQQFVVTDGFSHSSPQTYDRAHFTYDIVRREGDQDAPNYIENVFHLYKLHGSIDWRRKGLTIYRWKDSTIGDPVLIYPRDSKYQEAFETPYLDMMSAFQSSLREPDTTLIVSGFGFNDDHIARPVLAALEANMTMRLVICDVVFLTDASLETSEHVISSDAPARITGNAFYDTFRKLVEIGDQRIILVNGRFEDLSAALPDLVAETERERHMDRMARLREVSTEPANG
ncbi:SIR2 family protein [Bradyrhizobium septentrionale]|uniref:SIR2 family protein n=1 Tax=Bradyrhizobium septentrionale TaxID=1404411 RepID=UPI0015965D7C|nr:SIR2 family protein [Bradyrhizobium septentrionale]UGY25457.1 SIR2 family protein [Bradyrhizobium septentrionale]